MKDCFRPNLSREEPGARRASRPSSHLVSQCAATGLEADLDTKLQLPFGVGVADLAETTGAVVRVWQTDVRVIQHIRGRDFKLQSPAFTEQSQVEVLEQSQVHRSPVRSVDGIPTHVAEGTGRRSRERAGVKPTRHRVYPRRSNSEEGCVWNRISSQILTLNIRICRHRACPVRICDLVWPHLSRANT